MAIARLVGWIPNVGGRLSFSHIGHTNHPRKCGGLNESDSVGRVILCTQERPSFDALVPSAYVKFVYGYETTVHFVLIAETSAVDSDAQGKLKGVVLAFNPNRWVRPDGSTPSPAEWLSNALHEISNSAPSSAELATKLRGSLEEITAKLSPFAAYVVDCEIFRSGKAALSLNTVASGLTFAPSIASPSVEMQDRDIRYICNQAFMFLKDVAHNHRHHHKKQDTITLAYPEDVELSWIRDTAYAIHRRVIVKRRSAEPKDFYEALGLMAYMASLKKLADAEYDKAADDQKDVVSGAKIAASYNLKETEDSIKATLEHRRWRRTQWNIVITAVPAIIVSVGSLVKPADVSSAPNTIFGAIAAISRLVFPYDIYGAMALAIALTLVPWAYGALNPAALPPINYAKRILILLKQKDQAFALTFIGGGLLSVAGAGAIMTLVAPGQSLREVAWWMVGLTILTVAVFVFLAPYMATSSDLFGAIRTKMINLFKKQVAS